MSEKGYSEVSDISSMTSSDDDDVELMLDLHEQRIKNKNYLEEIVPQYSEEVFFEHFRLTRQTAGQLGERFEMSPNFNSQVGQYRNILALQQVLIYLWYIGHQTSSFRDVADRFGVTISSIHRIIHRITMFLSNLSPEIIKWPNENEKQIIKEHFFANGFPNVIGAIDGTHIKVDKPENDPDSYINRKGYYSIQMQAVCDHRRKIIDVFIGYPGSVHDSRVFRNSPLKNRLEEKCGRYYLLGDSGYPLLPNLLTPYKDRGNLTRRQQNYNLKLSKNRYVIEHKKGK
nr:putative nuclease HARBI1 [Leptinotarsa decemlineata]